MARAGAGAGAEVAAEGVLKINCAGPVFEYWRQKHADPGIEDSAGEISAEQVEAYRQWLVAAIKFKLSRPLYERIDGNNLAFIQHELPTLISALGVSFPKTPRLSNSALHDIFKPKPSSSPIKIAHGTAEINLEGFPVSDMVDSDPTYWHFFIAKQGTSKYISLAKNAIFAKWFTENIVSVIELEKLGEQFEGASKLRGRFENMMYAIAHHYLSKPNPEDGTSPITDLGTYLLAARALLNYTMYHNTSVSELVDLDDFVMQLRAVELLKVNTTEINEILDGGLTVEGAVGKLIGAIDSLALEHKLDVVKAESGVSSPVVEGKDAFSSDDGGPVLSPNMVAALASAKLGSGDGSHQGCDETLIHTTIVESESIAQGLAKPEDASDEFAHVEVTAVVSGEGSAAKAAAAAAPADRPANDATATAAAAPNPGPVSHPTAEVVPESSYWAWRLMLIMGLMLTTAGAVAFQQGLFAAWPVASLYIGAAAIALMVLLPLVKLTFLASSSAPMATMVNERVPATGSRKFEHSGPPVTPVNKQHGVVAPEPASVSALQSSSESAR